jgi:AcrR family transcriptional regulator
MARLTRAEGRARTTLKLLESAERLLATRGFAASSVDEIAEGAGFSRGAFYSNFASKEMLVLELLRRHMRGEIQQLRDVLADAPGRGGLEARLDAWAKGSHADHDWALVSAELQLLALRSPDFAAEYALLQDEHRRSLADVLSAIFARAGRTPPVDADELAGVVKALAQGLALSNALRPAAARIEPMQIIRLILGALVSIAPRAAQ